ncbi:MAG: hypothetical protein ACYCV7_14130 [Acidimicrobiales bacterium]
MKSEEPYPAIAVSLRDLAWWAGISTTSAQRSIAWLLNAGLLAEIEGPPVGRVVARRARVTGTWIPSAPARLVVLVVKKGRKGK